MYLIIPLVLIVFSACGIGYIIRPRLREIKKSDAPLEIKEKIWRLALPEFFNAWDKIDFHRIRKNALTDYEKVLRRVKILSLKTDNFINKLLENKNHKVSKPAFDGGAAGSLEKPKEESSDFKTTENKLIAEIVKNPKDRNLYKALGVLYAKNSMLNEASEVFNAVLKLDPEEDEAKKSLGKIKKIV